MKLRDVAPTTRVMVVAIVVSMVAFLDSNIVNLALPATERDLGGGISLQQWVVDGYLLALAAMVLPGGSISDLFGRVPVLRFGLAAFGTGALLAAAAAWPAMLIAARLIQGLGGVAGVALSAAGLGATVYALIEPRRHGWTSPLVATFLVVGVVALLAFVAWERRAPHPMMPPQLFAMGNFAGANLATAFVYGGLTLGSIATALYLQEVAGYPAIVAGLITLPTPIVSFLFARRVGNAAARIGPRVFLTSGPVLAAAGLLLICPYAHDFDFATHLLPGRLVLAAGLVLTITPLSSVILTSVEPARSGMAAAVQNAVGRISALTAVACVGLIAAGPLTDASFTRLLQVAAALYFLGAAVGGITLTNPAAPAEPVAVNLPAGAGAGATPALVRGALSMNRTSAG
jgi:Major Facilitator Superfamily